MIDDMIFYIYLMNIVKMIRTKIEKEWYKPENYLNHVPENADLTMIKSKLLDG